MRDDLEQTLFETYPEIFAERTKPMSQTAMCWGIECGNGWFDLLYDLCFVIQTRVDTQRAAAINGSPTAQVVATQVKEKLGAMCFYYRGGDDYVLHVVMAFELLSATRCEICGARGRLHGPGWLRTRCDAHASPLAGSDTNAP